MSGKWAKLGILLLCLPVPACGPMLDYCDDVRGVDGGNTPYGSWKRDFWGQRYFVPYPRDVASDAEDTTTKTVADPVKNTKSP
jgi:hypothetical protein